MGDGLAALILDVVRIAQKSGVVSGHRARSASSKRKKRKTKSSGKQILLMRGPADERFVLHISDVAHLERIEKDSIENLGGRKAVTYRGGVLMLVEVTDLLPERRETPRRREPSLVDEDSCVHVVVFNNGDRQFGMIVDTVMDIVDAPPEKAGPKTRDGVVGTILLEDRICELLDMDRIRAAAADLTAPVGRESLQGE
jgi:two-component system chemotaxis sensor kinase CheA